MIAIPIWATGDGTGLLPGLVTRAVGLGSPMCLALAVRLAARWLSAVVETEDYTMSCQENFFKQLRERGFRLTPQREMVLSVMHQIEGFATVEEIYEKVETLSSSVDVSTVYRNLELLQDFHLVASVDPGDGQRRYQLIGVHGAHLHLVCRSCGAVIGADLEPFRPLISYLKEQHGFEVDLEHMSIPGLCGECHTTHDDAVGRGRMQTSIRTAS